MRKVRLLLCTLFLLAYSCEFFAPELEPTATIVPTPTVEEEGYISSTYVITDDVGFQPFGLGNITPPIEDGGNVIYLPHLDYATFELSPSLSVPETEGTVSWNADEHTLNIKTSVPDVLLQAGLENYVLGVASETITNGFAVYISGAQGNRPTFALATAGTYTTAQAIGIATHDIAIHQEGFVTINGSVRGIDTRSYTDGDDLWLANNGGGAITNTAPLTGCQVYIGVALNSTVNGTILVSPDWRCDKFGDVVSGNYADFESDGTLVFYGDARVWDDIRVPAQATRISPVSSKPDFASFIDGTYAYHLDPDDEESILFNVQTPHGWDITYPVLEAHAHWTAIDTNAGNVVWGLECTYTGIGGTFGATTSISGTDAADEVAYKHQLGEMGWITMTTPTISSMMVCRAYRDADDPADTYPSDVALLEVDFHYLINSLGSREENEK